MRRIICGLILFAATSLMGSEQLRATTVVKLSGVLTHKGHQLPVKTVVSRWNVKTHTLTVTLLPYILTQPEIERVQQGMAILVVMNRKSPDPRFWKQPVYAEFSFNFAPGTKTASVAALNAIRLNFLWFAGKNSSTFATIPKRQIDTRWFVVFKGGLKANGQLLLRFKSQTTIGGVPFSWDLNSVSTIHAQ